MISKRVTALAAIGLVVNLIVSSFVLALEQHEDAETAKLVYSSISLLRYYSESLDFVLRKNAEEVEARLEKMPFANIPENLREPTDNFSASGISMSYLIANIDKNFSDLRLLSKQSGFDKAIELSASIYLNLSRVYGELSKLELAAEATGKELKMGSAPPESDLRKAYDEVLEKIRRIRELLDLYASLLMSATLSLQAAARVISPEEAEKLTQQLETTMEKLKEQGVTLDFPDMLAYMLLRPTALTLKVAPEVSFVGDSIYFEGVLTSEGKPLAGQDIDIILNSSRHITTRTDAQGRFEGVLTVPYWYVPELDVQALYYPRGDDVDIYLASLSPTVNIAVLFYKATLEVWVNEKAFPGLETSVTGKFNYGQSPPLIGRTVEVYLDDILVSTFQAQETFSSSFEIAPEAEVGEHTVTVSAAGSGKYSPVVADANLHVARAVPSLDLNAPQVAIIPGSISLSGRLHSEVGPVSGANIKTTLGESSSEMVSLKEGSFSNQLEAGWDFSLIGSQDLAIRVSPKEPWHSSLVTRRTIVVLNVINCGVAFLLLVLLGIYLPRRLKRRLGHYSYKKPTLSVPDILPEPVAAHHTEAFGSSSTKGEENGRTENSDLIGAPRAIILNFYRLAVRLILGITKALFSPQQTLREFARENGRTLGPTAGYFMELSGIVEKLLYSLHKPTEQDVARGRQLSRLIKEDSKRATV